MRCGGMTMDRSSPAAPIADLVTFGGSGLDRAGHLRGDAARIAALAADPATDGSVGRMARKWLAQL